MKEQRSLSVGSLPVGLKSHILKTIRYDHLTKENRGNLPTNFDEIFSEGLNKINELPEEWERLTTITTKGYHTMMDEGDRLRSLR